MDNEKFYQLIGGAGFLFLGALMIYDVTNKFKSISTLYKGNNYKLYLASFACLLIGVTLILGAFK